MLASGISGLCRSFGHALLFFRPRLDALAVGVAPVVGQHTRALRRRQPLATQLSARKGMLLSGVVGGSGLTALLLLSAFKGLRA